MKSLLFTAILSLRKRSEQILIKFAILLQVRLTHAQTFFRGVTVSCLLFMCAYLEKIFTRAKNYSTCWIFGFDDMSEEKLSKRHRALGEFVYTSRHEWNPAKHIALECAGPQNWSIQKGHLRRKLWSFCPRACRITHVDRHCSGQSMTFSGQ
jgi:hypothetical protein